MKLIFNQFFAKLNSLNIPYAITGRTEHYPENIHSDIDIVILKDQFNEFWDFMRNLKNDNIDWVQTISHESTAHYYVITLSDKGKHHIIKPDVCSDYIRNGSLFLKADYLLKNRVKNEKGFYVLAPEKEFVYYLLKKIDKGRLDDDQYMHLKKQWKLNSIGCMEAITPFFTVKNQVLVQHLFDNNSNRLELQKKIEVLKKNLHQNLNFNLGSFFGRVLNRMMRIVKPTGLVIAFMGPDGSGKTTIIDGVKKELTEMFRQNKQYHLFPKEGIETSPTINPHDQNPRGYFGSLAKLFYFLGLYSIGYWFKVYPLKIKSTLIIFDRYYHDILVDPKRYRNGTSQFWTKLIGYIIPKPDVWILLDVPGDVIQKRKAEVAPEECARQVIAYQDLFKKLDNGFIINGNQPPHDVIFDTEQIIINYLKVRTAKRYKNK
jgi:thymidylate kinase